MDGKISVVITFKGLDERLLKCLASLQRQTLPFELVLVDGAGGYTEGQGYIEAVKRSHGEYVAFTNADCIVPETWLETFSSWLDRGYDIAGGPRLTTGDLYSYAWNVAYGVVADMKSGLGFGWSNCMVRRSALGRVPLRDIKANQDLDFLIRAYREGLRVVFVQDVVVEHDHPLGSLGRSMRRQMLASENYTYLLRVHNGTVLKTGLGLEAAFFRYVRGFFSAGRLKPRYASLVRYAYVRFWVKVAQLCGFALGRLRDGVVDIH